MFGKKTLLSINAVLFFIFIVSCKNDALNDSFDRGFYDEVKNVFYLSELCLEIQKEQTILSFYIDYLMQKKRVENKLVKMAVCYVIYERFQLKHTIVKALFGKLEKMSPAEKWEFLKSVRSISKQVIDDMEGYTLDFNEIRKLCSGGISSSVYFAGICLLLGFGAKAGMYPLHIWLWIKICFIEQRRTEKLIDANFKSLAQLMDDPQLHGGIGAVDDIGYS